MKSVAQVLKSKPCQTVHTISPQASAYDASVLMDEKNIGALLVTENERIVGLVSERDLAR